MKIVDISNKKYDPWVLRYNVSDTSETRDSTPTVSWSPDSKYLAVGLGKRLWQNSSNVYDTSIKIYDVSSRECIKTLSSNKHQLISLYYSPDGTILHAKSIVHRAYDKSGYVVSEIDTKSYTVVGRGGAAHSRICTLSDSGRHHVKGISGWYNRCTLEITDVIAEKMFEFDVEGMDAPRLSCDGNFISCNSLNTHIYDCRDGRCVNKFSFSSPIKSFSPDGKHIAMCVHTDDYKIAHNYIEVYDTSSWKLVHKLDLPGKVRSVSFTCNSKYLQVICGENKLLSFDPVTAHVYDTTTWQSVMSTNTIPGFVSMHISPDASQLVTIERLSQAESNGFVKYDKPVAYHYHITEIVKSIYRHPNGCYVDHDDNGYHIKPHNITFQCDKLFRVDDDVIISETAGVRTVQLIDGMLPNHVVNADDRIKAWRGDASVYDKFVDILEYLGVERLKVDAKEVNKVPETALEDATMALAISCDVKEKTGQVCASPAKSECNQQDSTTAIRIELAKQKQEFDSLKAKLEHDNQELVNAIVNVNCQSRMQKSVNCAPKWSVINKSHDY